MPFLLQSSCPRPPMPKLRDVPLLLDLLLGTQMGLLGEVLDGIRRERVDQLMACFMIVGWQFRNDL